MASRYLSCAGREIHYLEWGLEHNDVIIMCHGLARCCHDFDALAAELSKHHRCIVPDMIGRGLSEWAHNATEEYCYENMGIVILDLLLQLRIEKMKWIGTSMGAGIGLYLASTHLRGRITDLVMNDMSPAPSPFSMQRIRTYVGSPPQFQTFLQFEQWIRTNYKVVLLCMILFMVFLAIWQPVR